MPEVQKRKSKIQRAVESGDIEDIKKALTVRQARFCEEYVIDFNGQAAAKRAGFTGNCMAQSVGVLLAKPHVRMYIDHLSRSKEASITIVDADYVIKKTIDGIDKAEKVTNLTAYFRGLELLARHLGMLRDKVEMSGPDGEAIKLEQLRTKEEMNTVISTLKSMEKKAKLKVVGGQDLEKDEMNG